MCLVVVSWSLRFVSGAPTIIIIIIVGKLLVPKIS